MGADRRSRRNVELQRGEARPDHAPGEVTQLVEHQLDKTRREQRQLTQQLAHQHAHTLRVMASRLVGHGDAGDVAQEAFVSLATWIAKKPLAEVKALLACPESLGKLMCRITSCRAYDFLRKRARGGWPVNDEDDLENTAVDESTRTPHSVIALARLELAYARLPPAQRVAHVLHYYYGFTDADFEHELGLTKTNSRTLVRRANLALKCAMAEP